MGLQVKHIQDHPGGRKSYRRAYPPHLRSYLGRSQLRVSLRRPNAPGFLTRYEAAANQWAVDVATAERKHTGAFDELDAPTIAYLGKVFEAQWLQQEDEKRREGTEGWAGRVEAGWEWLLDDFRRWYAEADADAAEEYWSDSAHRLLEAQGHLLDPAAGDRFRQLCMELNAAALRVSEVSQARLRGKVVPSPEMPERSSAVSAPMASRVPLIATFDAYAAAQGISDGVRTEWRRYIQNLVDFVGHDDAGKLVRDDVVRWCDHLLETPTRYGKPRKAITVKDKYLTSLRCTLGWALEVRKLPANVAADVKVRVPKAVKTRDPDFTMDEAKAILKASLQPPASRLSAPYVRARRWIPWLCAYSGARVNELSQLRKEDVMEVDGVMIVNITPDAGTVKTRQARQVPLHAHLVEQGFLEMVKAQPDGALFYDPSQQRVQADGNRHFKKVGEKLAKWVREEVGIADPAIKPNHAWRHLFKTLAADAGIQERVADAIQGHAPSSVAGKYGKVSLRAKADAIALFPRFEVG